MENAENLVQSENQFLIHGKERNFALDVMRIVACFMVVFVHVGDNYLVKPTGIDPMACIYATLLRPCVPLFVMISGALLLPMLGSTVQFYKRRLSRVLVPFLIWSVIYVFLPIPSELVIGGSINQMSGAGLSPILYNLLMIPVNFTASNVHFWFIFTLLGLYLIIPVISPWIRQVSMRGILFFLGLWSITLFFPYIQLYFTEIHGICAWNGYGTFYYFSGYLGYMILGYALMRLPLFSWSKTVAISLALIAVGCAITYVGFMHSDAHVGEYFKAMNYQFAECVVYPEANDAQRWKVLELFFGFLTPNVAMMTAGMFMLMRKIKVPSFLKTSVAKCSNLSFGIFLVHYIILLWCAELLIPKIQTFTASLPHMVATAVEMPFLALIVFWLSYTVTRILSRLPFSKLIIG